MYIGWFEGSMYIGWFEGSISVGLRVVYRLV